MILLKIMFEASALIYNLQHAIDGGCWSFLTFIRTVTSIAHMQQ